MVYRDEYLSDSYTCSLVVTASASARDNNATVDGGHGHLGFDLESTPAHG